MELNGIFTAVVTDVRLESRISGIARWQLALDSTLFSADSASGMLVAVAPSGARLEVPVLDVVEADGVVWHVVGKPLTEGTRVSGQTFRAVGWTSLNRVTVPDSIR